MLLCGAASTIARLGIQVSAFVAAALGSVVRLAFVVNIIAVVATMMALERQWYGAALYSEADASYQTPEHVLKGEAATLAADVPMQIRQQ